MLREVGTHDFLFRWMLWVGRAWALTSGILVLAVVVSARYGRVLPLGIRIDRGMLPLLGLVVGIRAEKMPGPNDRVTALVWFLSSIACTDVFLLVQQVSTGR